MTVDAAPVLLDLANSASDTKYEIRALRGYIRLARQFSMPEAQRVEMCREALETAKHDDEKKLVLEVLQRYPSIDMLRLAVEAAKVPSLKNDAAATSLVIAQQVGGSVDVQKLLTQIGQADGGAVWARSPSWLLSWASGGTSRTSPPGASTGTDPGPAHATPLPRFEIPRSRPLFLRSSYIINYLTARTSTTPPRPPLAMTR
jgi:hypothetical protein